MRSKQYKYSAAGFILIILLIFPGFTNPVKVKGINAGIFQVYQDTSYTDKDTSKVDLPYPFDDRETYPYGTEQGDSGLYLKTPSNIKSEERYDPETNEYIIEEKIGDMKYRPTRTMSIDEYKDYRYERSKEQYWSDKSRGLDTDGSSSFIPELKVGGEAFNKIFGSNTINITPKGSAELIFAIKNNKTENPNIQERLRSTTTFDFEENIKMDIQGTIGDKVKLGITYDTKATFDFENKTKIGYTGDEDEIIQKIEAGNISMPLTGSLITGSQNLFGIKTELKFGNLTMTNVFSQQKGKRKTIEVEGGAQLQEFEVEVADYDKNRHFFLSHFFKDNYNESLKNLPIISSGVTITKIEVWVTNVSQRFEDSRTIVGFVDLAENENMNIYNDEILIQDKYNAPANEANTLYNDMKDIVHDGSDPSTSSVDFLDYEYMKIKNARKLKQNEYSVNSQLGYISLNSTLRTDEVLAVAYEYQYRGKTYRVGELTSNNSESETPLIVKLIKGKTQSPRLPTWELMMKNVYSIGAYQVNREDFELNILYNDDKTGAEINYLTEGDIANKILLREMRLDQLNSNNDAQPDGVFDFVRDVTIDPNKGRIYFPVLEPFGEHLAEKLNDPKAEERYAYHELYDSTQVQAMQIAEKNKFLIAGEYKSSTGSEIPLNAMNIPEGSVMVTAGGTQLQENVDYTVDYTLGRVKIINEGILESGTPIQISLESSSLYSLQTKTLIGTNLNYRFSENFNVGGTLLNLTERPLTNKVNLGSEPISNTIWGVNTSYKTESQFLTTMVDKIPLIDAKKTSSINFFGEFAHLIPGHSRAIKKSGTAYIDDFEGSETSIDLRLFPNWMLSSTPSMFSESTLSNNLAYGYNRAKLAWYVIDPLFLRNNTYTPDEITKEMQSSHFVEEVFEKYIFPNKENLKGVPTNIPVLNLAYYPNQKGPYNYETSGSAHSAGVNAEGYLESPETRWGGIMREITTKDFEESNIAFIDFWMMDPFIEDYEDASGGDLYFNLGEISEDVLKDGEMAFENGLPADENDTSRATDTTAWGLVPEFFQIAGDGYTAENQDVQDVGLDGLNNDAEASFFTQYLQDLEGIVNLKALEKMRNDPSNDDYKYYKSFDYNENGANILQRYKNYNNVEGNSQSDEASKEEYSTGASTLADEEDINDDNTLNNTESYFQYKVSIRDEDLKVGTNYITDKRTAETEKFPNGESSKVDWYHFRIPIRDPDNVVGSISDFKSIRFMRMFLSNFSDSAILRFARLDLVRSDWRKYTRPLVEPGEGVTVPEPTDGSFDIGAVNIEENGDKSPVNYVLPPGINRVLDPSSPQLRQLNEQSIVLKIQDLADGDARAAYKNSNLDIREYKRLKMFVHAESMDSAAQILQDDDLVAFIRLGSDYKNNFYEYEIPLKVTPRGNYSKDNNEDRRIVWPEENEFNINLDDFIDLKLERNRMIDNPESGVTYTTIYTSTSKKNPEHRLSIAGNPDLAEVRTIMIGLRNPKESSGQGEPISAEVWMNEFRLTNFREEGGWAANARMRTQLSDFASVSISGGTVKPGFGSIEKKVSERSKEEEWRYDISSNIRLGKFFPEKAGVRLPMYLGYSQSIITPQYDPLQPDVMLEESLDNLSSDSLRDDREQIIEDVVTRKSLNFTNVGLEPKQDSKPKIYSPSNIALNYAYTETNAHNVNTEYRLEKQYKGGLIYNYTLRPKPVQPLKNVIDSRSLQLLRDMNFNYIPSRLSFQTMMSRRYNEKKIRNLNNLTLPEDQQISIDPTVDKDFMWTRDYGLKYDITRALRLDFTATNYARIDEPKDNDYLVVNRDSTEDYKYWSDSVKSAILDFGRTTQYSHKIGLNYNIPINKIQLLNWLSSSAAYTANYDWKAGPLMNDESLDVGNIISNSNTKRINAQANMTSLYNKVGVLKNINQKYSRGRKDKEEKVKKVQYLEKGVKLEAGKPVSIYHKLNTERITDVVVTSVNGQEIKGQVDIRSNNRLTFTADRDYSSAKVEVKGEIEEKESILRILAERTTYLLMAVKNISGSYSVTGGTKLPGYRPDAGLFGSQDINTPGFKFVTGWQDRDIGYKAIENEWLMNNSILNTPTLFTNNEQVNLRARIEPINDLQIDLSGNWSYSKNISEFYIPVDTSGVANAEDIDYKDLFPEELRGTMINGSFSMSYFTIRTAFDKSNEENNWNSEAFNDFKQNRQIIAQRLAQQRADTSYNYAYDPNTNYPEGYGPLSQDVLIPAFLSAYSKRDPGKINLNPITSFLAILQNPNWRVRYDGLSKIDWVKERFRSVRLNHSYRSSYNIGNYITNTSFIDSSGSYNLQGNFFPRYDMSNVSISEQFTPLIGIDVTLKNSLNARFEYRKSRTISLSLSNNRISEMHRNEFVIGTGYRFKEVAITINTRTGGQREFNSDLNVNVDYSIRHNKNILRDLDGPAQPSTGQLTRGLKISSDYNLSERFTLRLFFDKEISNPITSISYDTREWSAGFSVRFTLTQQQPQ